MTAGCENATTGGAQEDWGCAGLAEQGQGDQERSRRVVTDVSLQGSSGGLGVCRAGLRTGQGDRELSRRMVTAGSLQGCSGGLGCAGSAEQGAEGPGMLQEDGLSYIFVWLHVSL